jgi:phage terminase large subunit-like protein
VTASLALRLGQLEPDGRRRVLAGLSPLDARRLLYAWRFWARPEQVEPPGSWRTWVIDAGRGFGKTRSGAEWVRERIESGAAKSIAMIAATYQDLRDTMLGEGTNEPGMGFLNVWPEEQRPRWLEQKHRVEIPGRKDVHVMVWSADNPEFRGPNVDTVWGDEICKWPNPEALWNNIQFALRRPGTTTKTALTTTPSEEIPLLDEIEAESDTVVTRGSTFDNAANLDPAFIAKMVKKYGGTRLGLQELFAIVQRGARMFPKAVIDNNRARPPGKFKSAAVGVDPGVSQNRGSDQTGIVAGGEIGGHLYVTDDRTARHSAESWGFEVLEAFWQLEQMTEPGGMVSIVVERNKGGDLVRANLTMLITVIEVDPRHTGLRQKYGATLQRARHAIVEVHAFDGKKTRAEPVAAAHDQGRIHLAGSFPVLERQLAGFNPMI